ncbi:hypothetical protein Tco_1475006 [Tanacetum coccineum]
MFATTVGYIMVAIADWSTSMIETLESLRMAVSWRGVYLNASMEAFSALFYDIFTCFAKLPVSWLGITTRFELEAMEGWQALLFCYALANMSQPFTRRNEGEDPRKKVGVSSARFVVAAMAGWHALLSCYPLANMNQPFSRCDEWDV